MSVDFTAAFEGRPEVGAVPIGVVAVSELVFASPGAGTVLPR
jgi:hypothetical protein